jgi:DUF1365 family protein
MSSRSSQQWPPAGRSRIVRGEVAHWRGVPSSHSFSYPIFSFLVDLDELPRLSIAPRIFGVNRRAVLSIFNEDYLAGAGDLRAKVEMLLRERGVSAAPARITLITMPRYFGYVFNPVSFFACFDRDNRVVGLITEVHNTFGEAHIYPLVCEPSSMPVVWRFPKEFFVSPFFDTEGGYVVTLEKADEELSIRVDLEKDQKIVFSATLAGIGEPVTRASLFKLLWRYPVTSLLTMPRIHRQALNLFFKVGVCPFQKPRPSHPYTIRSQQNMIHRSRLWLLSVLRRLRVGEQ